MTFKDMKIRSRAIREKCLDCSENHFNILFCPVINCSLWYWRLRSSPEAIVNKKGKKYKEIFNKDNFKEGRIFSPDKEMSQILKNWRNL